jgi:hypothetical protein
MLRFAVAFALRGTRKLVRGLRHELDEAERFDDKTAADVFDAPWRQEAATIHQSFRPPGSFSALSFGTTSGA